MVVFLFHKLCRTAWSSKVHRTELVSVTSHAQLAAVCSIESDQLGYTKFFVTEQQ